MSEYKVRAAVDAVDPDECTLVFNNKIQPIACSKNIEPLCKRACQSGACILERPGSETPELLKIIHQFRQECESKAGTQSGPTTHSRIYLLKERSYTIRCLRLDTKTQRKPASVLKIVLHQALHLRDLDFEIIDRRFGLTKTELSILKECLVGQSPVEIARKRSVSTTTVKTHIRSMFRKLGISRSTQLFAKLIS
jgi:DNA-binding CsgD family transcriptional regulator